MKNYKKLKQKIRIVLKGYDYKNIDLAVNGILKTVRVTGSKIKGPVSLPIQIKKFAVNRSPHVDKKSMDIFELRIYKRILDIINPTPNTVDELKKLNILSGVEVNIII